MGKTEKFRIGDWTAVPALNLLHGMGRTAKLEPRAMEVLVYLAGRPGEVVSADDLITVVWQGRVVGEGVVYRCISQLRQALGDDGEHGRYIQTIPKRGYRLMAPVRLADPGTQKDDVAIWPVQRSGAAAAALLVLAVGTAWLVAQRPGQEDDAAQQPLPNSVAVLPFANLSPATENAYFAAGVHASIINQLGSLRNLSVIARSSVMQYEEVRISEVARDLRVESVMEGSVRHAGDQVLVTVQLIDGTTETQLWAGEYEGGLSDIFAFQADIATNVANALGQVLSADEAARLSSVPTNSERAYDFYLSGLDYFNRNDDELTRVAAQQLQRAVQEDPDFALAWAALARAHLVMYLQLQDRSEEREGRLALATMAVDTALRLAPQSGEPHLAMAYYHYIGMKNYSAALEELAIAEQRMPGRPEIYETRSYAQRRANEWISAIASMARAIELDPRNIDYLERQAENYLRTRDYKAAEWHYDRILDLAPDHYLAPFMKAVIPVYRDGNVGPAKAVAGTYPRLGWHAALYERDYDSALRYLDEDYQSSSTFDMQNWYYTRASEFGVVYALAEETGQAVAQFEIARAQIQKALDAAPQDARLHVAMGEALVGLGQLDTGVRAAHRALELAPRSLDAILGEHIQYDAIARVFGPAGDIDAVVDQLTDYLSQNGVWSIEGVVPDPRLDSARHDPRFQLLVEKYRRR